MSRSCGLAAAGAGARIGGVSDAAGDETSVVAGRHAAGEAVAAADTVEYFQVVNARFAICLVME